MNSIVVMSGHRGGRARRVVVCNKHVVGDQPGDIGYLEFIAGLVRASSRFETV